MRHDLTMTSIFAPTPGIESHFQRTFAVLKKTREANLAKGKPDNRLFHAKITGAAKVKLTVDPNRPEKYAFGIFRQPGEVLDGVVRFSNGQGVVLPDLVPDVRAMSIKFLGKRQDLIFSNHKAFPLRNSADMADLQEKGMFKFLFPSWWKPLTWQVQTLENLAGCVLRCVRNPLDEQYWTQMPYILGDADQPMGRAVKLTVLPSSGKILQSSESVSGDNFLHKNLAALLSSQEVSYDVFVQDRLEDEPLDNAAVAWQSQTLTKVATLVFDQQDIDAEGREKIVDALSFTASRHLPDFRPVGSIYELRALLYPALAKLRGARDADDVSGLDAMK